MEAKSTERRYNTRFRGVPKSVFTFTRPKKSSTKNSNETNHIRKDIRDDYIYAKLGKRSNHDGDAPTTPKNKKEGILLAKHEKKPPKSDINSNTIPNGTHKGIVSTDDAPPLKVKSNKVAKLDVNNVDVQHPQENDIQKSKASEGQQFKSKLNVQTDASISNTTDSEAKKIYTSENPTKANESLLKDQSEKQQNSIPDNIQRTQPIETLPPNDKSSDTQQPSIELPQIKVENLEELPSNLSPKDMDEGLFFEPKVDDTSTKQNGANSSWIPSKERLRWNNCNVAAYNPKTKMFRCSVCQAVGFMSRIGEHYLGAHCNAKVFHCPQCAYSSAWWRCVRNHMSKSHGVANAPASMWKNQPLLDEIMQILQNLKCSVDMDDRVERVADTFGKRYICPKCPYATDRRDLYNRHENIHREEKPFQCYICYKLFNRADHVKKHFCRIHKDYNYDINLIRRLPSKRGRIPLSPTFNGELSFEKPVPPQSRLMNCLTGSPTMVNVRREFEVTPEFHAKESSLAESKNDNTFNKSHSNLLTFLTQNAFSPKPIKSQSRLHHPPIEPPKEILQNALLKPHYPPPYRTSTPRKFLCPYCPWTGPNGWALRLHTSMHYRTFCGLCNFKAGESAELQKHMWEVHKKKACSKCNFLADSALEMDEHVKDVHAQKSRFSCRLCTQGFEVRSDMEAHCIFIHNQVLQECRDHGCDFCTTDANILQMHRKEAHAFNNNTSKETDPSASRTQCLYCGCDFADPQSLSLHEELFHENSLQKAGRRPLNPYGCSICGYSSPKQPLMIEHMRVHSGQSLHCQGCKFMTPYDTILREHVQQEHKDGITRCPHCGLVCGTRAMFVSHYQRRHHPFCCQMCEEVEHKNFVDPPPLVLNSDIKAMFPFARQVEETSNGVSDKGMDEGGRRSRKQMQPRKVVNQKMAPDSSGSPLKRRRSRSGSGERERFISLYAKKVRKLAQESLLRCRVCVRCPIYFRHKRNYVLHRQWHSMKKHRCTKCIQTFRHSYQVLLHQREHEAS